MAVIASFPLGDSSTSDHAFPDPATHYYSVQSMWFTENPWPPIVIAAGMALVFLVLWNSNRRGLHLLLAVVCGLLGAGFYFVERAIVTDGERLQLIVVQLCEDFRDKKPNVSDRVSDSRPDIKLMFEAARAMVTIQSDLRLSDFQTTLSDGNSQGTVHFRANATINVVGYGDVGYQPARFILTFQREKEDWKIIKIKRLNPINGKELGLLEQVAG